MMSLDGAPTRAPAGHDAALASLSVVVPAYNAARTLPHTIRTLLDEVRASGWRRVQVVVIDDGSHDGTARCLDDLADECDLVVESRANSGRFAARRRGLELASGDLVMLIDSRVEIMPGSMEFLEREVARGNLVWNAHVVTAPSRSLVAHFWDGITAIAWRRYYRDPRHVQLDASNYDYFPKGTTMFVAPRAMLLEACSRFDTEVDDVRFANDDTLLLRPLLEDSVINLAPQFRCRYEARTGLAAFTRHSFHRGTVLIDGHDRPGSRLRVPIRASLAFGPIAALCALRHPRAAVALGGAGCVAVGTVARWAGAERRAALSLAVLSPVFAVSYFAGMLRGVAVRARGRRRRRASESS
jgi:glycosyltransferase involved in cell wall biosynthesis